MDPEGGFEPPVSCISHALYRLSYSGKSSRDRYVFRSRVSESAQDENELRKFGGTGRVRTPDRRDANAPLCQLSYGPTLKLSPGGKPQGKAATEDPAMTAIPRASRKV